MSERKVLNKYYPPDFDPSKIPRMKLPKNRQYTVRLMAPFNMRCATCGEYIYRGKKFNARKEDVEGDDYCGIRIYRFYIKCTRCLQEISFKTDPRNTDYEIEAGATRNFMALKLAQEQEKREEEEAKEEEANNPMKLLENRTQQSKIEIELMECLEEIKDLNRRHYNIDFNELLKKYNTDEVKEKLLQMQKEKDEKLAKELIAKKRRKDEKITDEDVDNSKKQKVVEEIIEESLLEDNEAISDFDCSKKDSPSSHRTSLEKLKKISDEIKQKKDDPKIATNSGFGIPNNFASHKSTLEKLKSLNNLKKPNKNTNSIANTSSEGPKKSEIIDEKPNGNALMSLCSYSDSDNSD